jgi:hypothetical protein
VADKTDIGTEEAVCFGELPVMAEWKAVESFTASDTSCITAESIACARGGDGYSGVAPSTNELILATREADFGDVPIAAATGVPILGEAVKTADDKSTLGEPRLATLGVAGLSGGKSDSFGLVT